MNNHSIRFAPVPLRTPAAWLALTAVTLSSAWAGFSPSEQNVIDIFKRVSPSVVSVANKAVLQDLFSLQLYEVPQGTGSGFMWDREGHIISNFHVIYGASAVQVTLQNGASYNAEVVGADPDYDIAVLKIAAPASVFVPIEPGSSRTLQVGQTVLAIGNPFGLDTSLSVGVVSALGRSIVSLSRNEIHDVIQTDAAINPGNSGGPLLDSSGRLIGMNTAILSPSGAYAGVGFAVPVDTVRRVVTQLIATGRVQRAGLGVRPVPDHIMRQYGCTGVAVLSVDPRGAAAQAGLRGARQTRRGGFELGDVLIEADGRPVNSTEDLAAIMERHQAGDVVKVVFQRGKERLSANVTLQSVE